MWSAMYRHSTFLPALVNIFCLSVLLVMKLKYIFVSLKKVQVLFFGCVKSCYIFKNIIFMNYTDVKSKKVTLSVTVIYNGLLDVTERTLCFLTL